MTTPARCPPIALRASADAGRIDDVLHRGPHLRAVAVQTPFDTEVTRASDHFGLLVDFAYSRGEMRDGPLR